MSQTTQFDAVRRFGGLDRLYGAGARLALQHAHVMVAGIGGVGTWCAEALARSSVGKISLIDLDHIAESNINRQLHALESTLGQSKTMAMAQRIQQINPACQVHCIDDFVEPHNVADLLLHGPAVMIDCTDQVSAKIALVVEAKRLGVPLLTCGGAGGKTDPLSLRSGDLSLATHDALLGRIRTQLRKQHGYARASDAHGHALKRVPRMGVACLWFEQPTRLPEQWEAGRDASLQGLACAGYGSAVALTATMGLCAADYAIRLILNQAGVLPAA